MQHVIEGFVIVEFVIGVGVTLWFAMKWGLFPVIDYIVDYWRSYEEFKRWRERNG